MSVKDVPEKLQPYVWHGADINWQGSSDAEGECPFCSGDKFHVSQETGQYHCKHCGADGNVYTFLNQLWVNGSSNDLAEFAKDRQVSPATLRKWGATQVGQRWVLPTFNIKKRLTNIYIRIKIKESWRLLTTPTLDHQLFGLHLWKPKLDMVCLCEGPWDAMVLWELIPETEIKANVLGVPGANVFKESWVKLFAGKDVRILYDNDHPKERGGRTQPPAGWQGTRRATEMLHETARSIEVLRWGPEGYDPEIPTGTDVRDALTTEVLSV